MTQLACPNCGDGEALGTVEQVTAVAHVVSLEMDEHGHVEPEYAGESEVIWDEQIWDGKQVKCYNCLVVFDVPLLVPLVTE